MRLKLVEEEQRGGIDLSRFYERPELRSPASGPPASDRPEPPLAE
jgi:hypothetical protein